MRGRLFKVQSARHDAPIVAQYVNNIRRGLMGGRYLLRGGMSGRILGGGTDATEVTALTRILGRLETVGICTIDGMFR